MSLKIFYGSRIEDLAEKLVEELKAERAANGPHGSALRGGTHEYEFRHCGTTSRGYTCIYG